MGTLSPKGQNDGGAAGTFGDEDAHPSRSGANISDNCLQRLSFEIARIKSAGKAKIEAIAEEIAAQYDAKPLLEQPAKPKAKRGRPKKKAA